VFTNVHPVFTVDFSLFSSIDEADINEATMTDATYIYIKCTDREGHMPTNYRMVSEKDRGERIAIKGGGAGCPRRHRLAHRVRRNALYSEESSGGHTEIMVASHPPTMHSGSWTKSVRHSTPWPQPVTFTGPDGATYSIARWLGWGTRLDNIHVIPVRFSAEPMTFSNWWEYQ